MAEVAGVGPAGGEFGDDGGTGNLVAADGLEHAVGRVRHVAVVAERAARSGAVPRVGRDVGSHILVALQAGLVALHSACELVVGLALVERMAREAGHRGLSRAVLEAGRFDQAVELAAGHADHAVLPEELVEQGRMFRGRVLQPGLLVQLRWPHDRRRRVEVVAGPVTESRHGPVLRLVEPLHRMARAADLRRALRRQVFRMDDRRVARAFGQLGPARGLLGAPMSDVLLPGPVAGLAGDSQIGGAGVENLLRRIPSRLSAGRVTTNARAVPDLNRRLGVGVADERVVPGNPTAFLNQPGERKADVCIAIRSARQPEDLHVVRAGHEARLDLERLGLRLTRHYFGSQIGDGDPAVGSLHRQMKLLVAQQERDVVEVRMDSIAVRRLRHRPMKRPVPALVLGLMAFLTGRRTGVTGRFVARLCAGFSGQRTLTGRHRANLRDGTLLLFATSIEKQRSRTKPCAQCHRDNSAQESVGSRLGHGEEFDPAKATGKPGGCGLRCERMRPDLQRKSHRCSAGKAGMLGRHHHFKAHAPLQPLHSGSRF